MATDTTAFNQAFTCQNQNPRLRDRKLKDLTVEKRRLVEVPYTATLAHTMNALLVNQVSAVPVAAPPGHWIGAGGSMIMESDKLTGAVRKHYIGMVNMFDILAHIAGDGDNQINGGDGFDLDQKMAAPVSSIIGHSLEDLSLWTLNPDTNVIDSMEILSKGVHRVLVPVDSQMDNMSGVELVESASSYLMVTQMDLLKFFKEQYGSKLKGITSRSVGELGAVSPSVFAITDSTKVIDAIKCMRAGMLNAVPIVEGSDNVQDHNQLIQGIGRKLLGTFSATDLKGTHMASLKTCLHHTALYFTEEIMTSPLYSASGAGNETRELVTCQIDSPLDEAIDKAVSQHVHRIWVVDRGLLVGLIALTDIIRVLRMSILSDPSFF